MRSKLISIFLLCLACIPAILPLVRPGFFTMHDDQQIVRLFQLDESLKSGQFPVRWVDDLGFGYGYPLFNFYPPFVYYLGELFLTIFQTSYIGAMKLVFATSFIASGLSMFAWSKKHFGNLAGIVSGLFYVYAPYRAVDAYVRGALAEAFSFVWLPVILLAMDQLYEAVVSKKNQSNTNLWIIVLGGAYACLMLTHNLIVLPFSILMVLYFLAKLLVLDGQNRLRYFKLLFPAGIFGLGLSAFFWLPSLSEMKFTLVDKILLQERYEHSLHYVAPAQLWNSLWGYGGSSPDQLDGFSFKIGKVHVVVSALVGLFSVSTLLLDKLKISSFQKYGTVTKKYRPTYIFIFTCFSLFLFSSWMTTRFSSIIWDSFSPIQFLQFPWRFLTFTSLFSSVLAGGSVWLLEKVSKNFLVYSAYTSIIILLLFIPNLKLFHPQFYLDVTDDYYTSDEFTKWKISKTSFEFSPKEVETTTENDLGITQLAITQDQVAGSVAEVVNGKARIQVIKDTPTYKQIEVAAEDLSLIQFNTFNFPGWQLDIDGQKTAINDDNRLKLISSLITGGTHLMTIRFTDTPVRQVANLISIFVCGLMLGFLIKPTIMIYLKKK